MGDWKVARAQRGTTANSLSSPSFPPTVRKNQRPFRWSLRLNPFVPEPRTVAHFANRKHHRHFNQPADDEGKSRAGTGAKQRDGHRHRQFKKVARANERTG